MKKLLLLGLLLCMSGCTTVVTVDEEEKPATKIAPLTTGRKPKCNTTGCICPPTATCMKSGCMDCDTCGACSNDCSPDCKGCSRK